MMSGIRWQVVLVGAALVAASPEALAHTYTVKDAVKAALEASDAVSAAVAKTEGQRAKADEAFWSFTPKVSLSGGWVHWDTAPYIETAFDVSELMPEEILSNPIIGPAFEDAKPQSFRLDMGLQDNFQVQLQAEQVLFAGTALVRQRRMALAQVRSAEEEARGVRHDVIKQVEELFWQLVLAREAVAVTTLAIETAETHVGLLEAYIKAEVASRADLLAAKVQLANLRLSALQAAQAVELAEGAFRVLVHVPAGEPIVLDRDKGLMPLKQDLDVAALTERAWTDRPELRVLGHQLSSTQQAAGASWATWLPAVALLGNVYLKNPDRSIEPNWYWSGDVTFGFQWQLWDRGLALQRHRQARAGEMQIEAYRRQLRAGVGLEIDQALANIRQAEKQVEVAREAVALGEENLRLQQVSFKASVARSVDVLEAQTALSKSRLDLLGAETRYRIAAAGLRYAVGLGLEE